MAQSMLSQWLGVLFLATILAIFVGGSLNYVLHTIWTWQREQG